jgi:topoisomerase-4 subunit A
VRRALHLIESPNAQPIDEARRPRAGAGLPDRRHHRRRAAPRSAKPTHRPRLFRVRARWRSRNRPRGTWVVVVTEIPYQVQKSKLIEKIAELLNDKKLPLLADVRDESTEDVRVVLEPKIRTVDAGC